MPACTTCRDVSGGKDLANPKCQDCLRKEAEKFLAWHWEMIAQHHQNCEMCDEDMGEYLNDSESDLRYIEGILRNIERYYQDSNTLWDSLHDLKKRLEEMRYPKTLSNIISDAHSLTNKQNACRKDRKQEHVGPIL